MTPEEVPILSGGQRVLLNNARQQKDRIKMCVLKWTLAMEDALDWGRVWAHTRQNQGDFGESHSADGKDVKQCDGNGREEERLWGRAGVTRTSCGT